LEATYQTNDSAIYGISVNEAFCVTGSEDTYLRVWPLDFSEFFMEAKHEGTVGSV
jgi:WD repeat-containing protein 90